MTDRERQSFIKGATQRPPGKRQIKPTAAALAEIELEDESDEDFNPGDSGSEPEGDSEEDSDEEAEDEEDEQEEEEEEEQCSTELVCSICLNFRKVDGDKVIQCDKCGVAVHESCYAVDDYVDDSASQVSNFSTEPWFCEPCLYGLEEPPHCELCPRRTGAFKRADVGGKFVHLICALYTSGISFGDVDNLTAVSWQEIDYRRFGRKSCDACNSVLESRTGIVTCCEAGLCKQHYHITCAQNGIISSPCSCKHCRMGFLVDSENEHQNHPSCSQEKQHIDPCFILCRSHNASEVVQKKRNAYNAFAKQEDMRMVKLKFRVLNNREAQKLTAQRKHYEKRLLNFKNVTIHLPSVKNKRQRLVQSSANVLGAFAEKAELVGFSKQEFEDSFLQVHPSEISFIAPSFTNDFIRNNVVFKEETERFEHHQRELAMLEREETDLKRLLDETKKRTSESKVKQHEHQVDKLYDRFLGFLKKMPVRFDRSAENGKKVEKKESVEPPPNKKKRLSLRSDDVDVIVLDSPPRPSDRTRRANRANSASLSRPTSVANSSSGDVSPPPLLDPLHSRSTSADSGSIDDRPILLPMISQNGVPKRASTRPKRGLKA